MKDFLSKKLGKASAAVALLLVVFWVILRLRPELRKQWPLLEYVLFALIVFGLLWLAMDLGFKAWQRRRQASFDARMAAREGIEDRRREWAEWTTELRRQGIDRYQLPMYILVGEPQSGKSVMLRNSDLHFPFGQNRLSGVGGTRGCDWWFTDQAVILDLAGRLFTHEGGASDEAEWAAFLELLADFRPQCPANGVILVLPCDGLASEAEPAVAKKAAKMQSALVTLTNKLQARLPVYVVLTKGDKVFGFAECVHRLDAEKRHEMFGWSRALEKLEAPFDVAEAQAGFLAMVERGRLLRSQMLATARIPEALSEVDRFYAFPEELAALWPMLSMYLRRVFTESKLIDQFFFRGMYLTSGLQSGAPIAKVCAELLGTTGEADRRSLEGLFTKQRAYFIKDLIRERIFTEQGLVRPTRQRVLRARGAARLAYGIAGVLAVVSIGASIWGVNSSWAAAEIPEFVVAEKEADNAIKNKEDPGVQALIAVDGAAKQGGLLSPDYSEQFERIYDARLVPFLQEKTGRAFAESPDPTSFRQFEQEIALANALLSEVDLREPEQRSILARVGLDPNQGRELDEALDSDYDLAPFQIPAGEQQQVIARADRLWEGVLQAGSGWAPPGPLGHVLACMHLLDGQRIKKLPAGADCDEAFAFANALFLLGGSRVAWRGDEAHSHVPEEDIEEALAQLEEGRAAFQRLAHETPSRWPRADAVRTYCGKGPVKVPRSVPETLADEDLGRVCNPSFLSERDARSDPGRLLDDLAGRPQKTGIADEVFLAKCRCVEAAYVEAFPDLQSLRERLAPSEDSGAFVLDISRHLGGVRRALSGLDACFGWKEHGDELIDEYEQSLLREWGADRRDMHAELMEHFDHVSPLVKTTKRSESLTRIVELLVREFEGTVQRAAAHFRESIPPGVSEGYAGPLRKVASDLSAHTPLDGPTLSVRLVEAAAKASAAGSGGEWFVERLYAALCEFVLREQVRAEFVRELAGRIGPKRRFAGLVETLWEATPSGKAELEFLDQDGEFDQLLARYRIRPLVVGEEGPATWTFEQFRSPAEDGEAWDAVAFLREFQVFLLSSDQKSAAKAKVEIVIECDDECDVFRQRKWLHVRAGERVETRNLKDPRPVSIAWGFDGASTGGLKLRWSDVSQSDRPRADDYSIDHAGILAPFRLAWTGAADIAGLVWQIDMPARSDDDSQLAAKLTLSFPRRLPSRPAARPFSD